MSETLLTAQDIERIYNLPRHQTYRLISEKVLPAVRIGERRLFVRKADLEGYLQKAGEGI